VATIVASRAGFSLVEAIVALGVIATGIVTLAGLAVRTTDAVQRARERSVASWLADAALAELAARGVAGSSADCLLSNVSGCVEYRDGSGGPVAGPPGAYALRWHAAPVPSSPVPATLLTVCAVPAREQAAAARVPGACASRVLMEPWP
jgi:type II secretory pathway pseudopilin PulG